MGEAEKRAKSERLIQEATKVRGFMLPEWEFICNSDPDYFEGYNRMWEHCLGKKEVLPIKVREFISMALLIYKGFSPDIVAFHIKRAMNNGATEEEILEVFKTMLIEGGAPAVFNGVKALLSLKKKDAGKK